MIRPPDWWDGDVSRETLEAFTAYAALVRKWTPKINLIAKSTIADLEDRHIWDSAQVYEDSEGLWVDLGSGGGMPGIVAAILGKSRGIGQTFTLIESDQRKAAFLRTCVRELDLPATVLSKRIETVPTQRASVVSARALADLNTLLGLAERHLEQGGLCIFQKGAKWQSEVDEAQQNWRFSCDVKRSKTSDEAVILKIKDIERV